MDGKDQQGGTACSAFPVTGRPLAYRRITRPSAARNCLSQCRQQVADVPAPAFPLVTADAASAEARTLPTRAGEAPHGREADGAGLSAFPAAGLPAPARPDARWLKTTSEPADRRSFGRAQAIVLLTVPLQRSLRKSAPFLFSALFLVRLGCSREQGRGPGGGVVRSIACPSGIEVLLSPLQFPAVRGGEAGRGGAPAGADRSLSQRYRILPSPRGTSGEGPGEGPLAAPPRPPDSSTSSRSIPAPPRVPIRWRIRHTPHPRSRTRHSSPADWGCSTRR
jgi:hypothetical protein